MKISVIIPSYNRADLVGETLHSVLAQIRPPDEILVVDDGSTDDTRSIVGAFGPRVRYHYQENGGLTAARRAGLTRTTGDAVLMLDSDDLLRPSALARLEAALVSAPDAALAYCRTETVDIVGRPVPAPWTLRSPEGNVWAEFVEGNHIGSPGAALIRRVHLDRADGPDGPPPVADWGLWLRLAEDAPFVHVPEPLFLYRVHAAGMSRNDEVMHWALYQLRRGFLRRYRCDPARRRAVAAAQRRGRHLGAALLLTLAYGDRQRGDARTAWSKLTVAMRLRPGYLLNWGTLRCILGTLWRCRRSPGREGRSAAGHV